MDDWANDELFALPRLSKYIAYDNLLVYHT